MTEVRQLHLCGALGAARVEQYQGREHLIVPVVALMDGVIHAVNASTPERVTAATLSKAAQSWNGRPLVLGHPTKNGRQCSANEPSIEASHRFGTIFNSRMAGQKLLMDAYVDTVAAERLGGTEFVQSLREGRQCEVSVGAFVTTDDVAGTYNGKPYKATWLETIGDHLAFLPGGRGACSIEMGCGAHRAAMHLVTAEGLEMLEEKRSLKERILALFSSSETLQDFEQALEDEQLETLGGAGSGNYGHAGRKGQVGGSGGKGGGGGGGVRKEYQDAMDEVDRKGREKGESYDDAIDRQKKSETHGYVPHGKLLQWAKGLDANEADKVKADIVRLFPEKSPSQVNEMLGDIEQGATWKFTKPTVGKKIRGAASKDCSVCGGTGQVQNEKQKQEDCPSCEGSGKITTAEAVQEVQMKKVDAIKALTACPCSGFTVADAKELEGFTEERLTIMAEASAKRAADLKAAQDSVVTLKAAAEKQPTEEEYLAKAPASIRTLVEDKKKADAAEKATIVAALKTASSVLSEEQLNAKTLDELKILAQFAKIETPVVDYSGRGIPVQRAAASFDDYTPPDPYEAGIKALQGKTVN